MTINKFTPVIDSKLAAYTALATVALAAPVAAKADIVYSGVLNLTVPSTTAGIYLNLVNGVFATTPSGAPGWDINPWGSGSFFLYGTTGNGFINNFAGGSSATLVDNLPLGTTIDGASGYTFGNNATETTGSTAFLLNSSSNVAGFRFINEAAGNQVQYGWVRFSLAGTAVAQPRLLVEYAYDNTGASILAGQTTAVPEPSTYAFLGLMATGAFAVRRWRKHQTA
ncbi:MAG: PEP-CTERM sorting domain-containing protein [Limisphaerales bacterium]